VVLPLATSTILVWGICEAKVTPHGSALTLISSDQAIHAASVSPRRPGFGPRPQLVELSVFRTRLFGCLHVDE
jgi:hypothetical protein